MKINKFEYESLVRDSQGLAILREIRRRKIQVSDEILDVFCELQSDEAPEDKSAESVVIEVNGSEIKKAVDKLYEDFLDENYEPHKETISESTPPEEHPAQCVGSGPYRKKGIDKGKVMALHNAGWTQAKIADEMGCSIQRVCQIVKEENKNAE